MSDKRRILVRQAASRLPHAIACRSVSSETHALRGLAQTSGPGVGWCVRCAWLFSRHYRRKYETSLATCSPGVLGANARQGWPSAASTASLGRRALLNPILCRRTGNGAPRSPGSGGSPNNSAGAYPSTGQTSPCCSERVPLGRHEDALAGHQAGSRVEGSDKAAYRRGATGNFPPRVQISINRAKRGMAAWSPVRGVAIQVIRQDGHRDLVFPGARSALRPMSENTSMLRYVRWGLDAR